MKNFIFTLALCFFILSLGMSACKSGGSTKPEPSVAVITGTADNSKNSLDWKGTYTGTVPCADCAGIFTQITLNKDNTYTMKREYLGKEGSAEKIIGTFVWNEAGNTIILSGLKEKSMPSAYQVGENKLVQLDMKGNVITGELASSYVLNQIDDKLVEKKWKLVEINGVALSSMKPQPTTGSFIIFQISGNRMNGNSGCNNFTGTYKMEPAAGLHFSGVASTRKMCADMTIEDQMNKLFQSVDSYSIQGGALSLNGAGTPLMRFALSE